MRQLSTGHPAGLPATLTTLVVALAGALAGCSSPEDLPATASSSPVSSTASSTSAGPPVAGEPVRLVSATLEDAVVPRDDGRISWTTTWRACFAPAAGDPAGVTRWEAQLVTPEGASPQVEELAGNCVELDVATGVNPADMGLLNREIQLSDAAGLTYRVRAVGEDGTATPWTDPVRVTAETPG